MRGCVHSLNEGKYLLNEGKYSLNGGKYSAGCSAGYHTSLAWESTGWMIKRFRINYCANTTMSIK